MLNQLVVNLCGWKFFICLCRSFLLKSQDFLSARGDNKALINERVVLLLLVHFYELEVLKDLRVVNKRLPMLPYEIRSDVIDSVQWASLVLFKIA
jgi:hypothetical protein